MAASMFLFAAVAHAIPLPLITLRFHYCINDYVWPCSFQTLEACIFIMFMIFLSKFKVQDTSKSKFFSIGAVRLWDHLGYCASAFELLCQQSFGRLTFPGAGFEI
jgi:hypothetical protein